MRSRTIALPEQYHNRAMAQELTFKEIVKRFVVIENSSLDFSEIGYKHNFANHLSL